MKVLHLFSDHRWTGPAEPVVELIKGLRGLGVDATLACRRPPGAGPLALADKATDRGVEPVLDFALNRHCPPLATLRDLARLPRFIRERQFDVVHCHLSHDHVLGGWSARRAGRNVRVVRTNHKGRPLPRRLWDRVLLGRYTDAYMGFSRAAAEADQIAFGLRDDQVFLMNPSVDLERFDPTLPRKDVRSELSLAPDDLVGAVVARVQRHRRWDVLLEAVKLAAARVPNLRLLIIGKGTHIDAVAKQPVAEMGLQDTVLFPGYRFDDYVDFLAGIDFKVFMKPGSDGTCRAVREAMAMGKPVVAARIGLLPELAPHEEAGLIVDDEPQHLADAIVRLAEDPALRARLGEGARRLALERFRLQDQVAAVAKMYDEILSGCHAAPTATVDTSDD